MASTDERLIELEIRFTHQDELLGTLNEEMVKANRQIEQLTTRVRSLEATVRGLMDDQPLPPSEKPPHY